MTESHPPDARVHDEWVVVRCQLGERDAFDELIERWHEPLRKYVRRVAGEDGASDVVQDVWLRVLRGIGRLRDGTKLRPWLFGIARRAVMDRLREQYARGPVDDVDVGDIPDESSDASAEADLELLEQELALLPVVERDVLTLFYLRELSLREVADVLDVPIGTVKSRLFRARQLLRRELDKRGGV